MTSSQRPSRIPGYQCAESRCVGLYEMSKACFDLKVYDEASLHASVAIAIMANLSDFSSLYSCPGFGGLTIPPSLHALRGNALYEMFIQNDDNDDKTKKECLQDILDDYDQCMILIGSIDSEKSYSNRTLRFVKWLMARSDVVRYQLKSLEHQQYMELLQLFPPTGTTDAKPILSIDSPTKNEVTAKEVKDCILTHLKCPICLETIYRPLELCSNGHIACEKCILDLLAHARNADEEKCPNCREPFDNFYHVPVLDNIISSLVKIKVDDE